MTKVTTYKEVDIWLESGGRFSANFENEAVYSDTMAEIKGKINKYYTRLSAIRKRKGRVKIMEATCDGLELKEVTSITDDDQFWLVNPKTKSRDKAWNTLDLHYYDEKVFNAIKAIEDEIEQLTKKKEKMLKPFQCKASDLKKKVRGE